MKPVGILIAGLLMASSSFGNRLEVEQPARAFGYVIGDMLEQRVKLEVQGKPVELAVFPLLQRVGPWLQRRSAELERGRLNHSWLVLRYQVINSPVATQLGSLPALELHSIDGAPLIVEAWPISISPLTPAAAVADPRLPPMRLDHEPMAPDTSLAKQRLKWSMLLLLSTLSAWLGWWIWRRQAEIKRLPFARAWNELRGFENQSLEQNLDAWLVLHRAFNRVGGRSIHYHLVAELVHQHPWLSSMQPQIEAFYAASATRFFAQSEPAQAFALDEFCRHLYFAEKRHAGASKTVLQVN